MKRFNWIVGLVTGIPVALILVPPCLGCDQVTKWLDRGLTVAVVTALIGVPQGFLAPRLKTSRSRLALAVNVVVALLTADLAIWMTNAMPHGQWVRLPDPPARFTSLSASCAEGGLGMVLARQQDGETWWGRPGQRTVSVEESDTLDNDGTGWSLVGPSWPSHALASNVQSGMSNCSTTQARHLFETPLEPRGVISRAVLHTSRPLTSTRTQCGRSDYTVLGSDGSLWHWQRYSSPCGAEERLMSALQGFLAEALAFVLSIVAGLVVAVRALLRAAPAAAA